MAPVIWQSFCVEHRMGQHQQCKCQTLLFVSHVVIIRHLSLKHMSDDIPASTILPFKSSNPFVSKRSNMIVLNNQLTPKLQTQWLLKSSLISKSFFLHSHSFQMFPPKQTPCVLKLLHLCFSNKLSWLGLGTAICDHVSLKDLNHLWHSKMLQNCRQSDKCLCGGRQHSLESCRESSWN